ncbi:MAG: hypothetical protein AB8F95_03600 [Bacteroidia bacterium]
MNALKPRLYAWCLLGAIVLTIASCAKRNNVSWDTDLLTPLAYGEVSIADLVPDSLYEPNNAQGYASVVFADTFTLYRLTDELTFSDTVARFPVRLDSLTLISEPIEERITLQQIADQLLASTDPIQRTIGQTIIDADGDVTSFPFPVTGLTAGPVPIDASAFFDEAIIQSGFLRLTIENTLPLDLENVSFTVENGSGPPPIITDQFRRIRTNETVTKDYDVSGQSIESILNGGLTNIDIPAAFNVQIDLNDYLRIEILPVDLKVEQATAVFPDQTVVDDTTFSVYDFDAPYQDILLQKMIIKSGRLEANSISTIQDTIGFAYTIPNAQRNGIPPLVELKINPAQPNIPSVQSQNAVLEGFTLDLTMNGERINAVQQRLQVNLIYSGNKVTIGLKDSVDVKFGLLDIEPTFIQGYLGQQTFEFSGKENIDLFDNINASRIFAAKPKLSLLLGNSFGVNASLDVQKLEARNAQGERVNLRGGTLRAGPLMLQGISLPDTFGIAYTSVRYDDETSNLANLLTVLPNELEYNIKVQTNPDSRGVSFDDFATNDSRFDVILEAEIPLEGSLENLQLLDTLDLDFASSTGDDVSQIQGGELRLLLDNEFPLEARVWAVIVDPLGNPIATLAENSQIAAAQVDPATGRTTEAVRTAIPVTFDQELLQKVINEAASVQIRYTLDTKPNGENVRFYDNYRLQANLVGAFTYRVE